MYHLVLQSALCNKQVRQESNFKHTLLFSVVFTISHFPLTLSADHIRCSHLFSTLEKPRERDQVEKLVHKFFYRGKIHRQKFPAWGYKVASTCLRLGQMGPFEHIIIPGLSAVGLPCNLLTWDWRLPEVRNGQDGHSHDYIMVHFLS